jgi:glycolate oxidase
LGPSKVLTSEESCSSYVNDESDVVGRTPSAVVIAASADDIAVTLAVAEETGVPVTPRAGGTGKVGGAVPVAGGIVLATHSLASIVDIDRVNLVATVEPGVITGDLHAAVEREGLFYGPDPNSADSCRIGGNLAANAGGPRAFKYGVTRDWVLGVDACLMGGQQLRLGRRTRKGVTGYDVTGLLIGSEGTLAVFTRAVLRLLPKPPAVATALALFSDVRAAAVAVGEIVNARIVPRCLELLDSATLRAVRAAGVALDERAGAMLLIEVDDAAADATLLRAGEAALSCSGCLDVVVAQDGAQRDRLWAARHSLSRATRQIARHKLSEDIVVPPSKIPELLDRIDEIGDSTKIRHLCYGHAGDGNLHVNFFWDDDGDRPNVDRAISSLMRETVELGGTLSGEHGIGVSKAQYLGFEQSDALIALQRRIKQTFDPKGLLNPGKIFPTEGHGAC